MWLAQSADSDPYWPQGPGPGSSEGWKGLLGGKLAGNSTLLGDVSQVSGTGPCVSVCACHMLLWGEAVCMHVLTCGVTMPPALRAVAHASFFENRSVPFSNFQRRASSSKEMSLEAKPSGSCPLCTAPTTPVGGRRGSCLAFSQQYQGHSRSLTGLGCMGSIPMGQAQHSPSPRRRA